MDRNTVSILLTNLRQRIERKSSGNLELDGVITDNEFEALDFAVDFLTPGGEPDPPQPAPGGSALSGTATFGEPLSLNLSVLDLPPAPESDFLCLDFGTALSKAAIGHTSDGMEDIQILEIGIPGDQEQISSTKLESAIYIDNAGVIWFGHEATEKALQEQMEDESRAIVYNIKRFLSEGTIEDEINDRMNPTHLRVTNQDLILAYLAFLTWCVTDRLSAMDVPRNIRRRFAMPCLKDPRRSTVISLMKSLAGKAQILADTFGERFTKGIDLGEFLNAAQELEKQRLHYSFIDQEIVEPLAVAGAIMSWRQDVKALLLVVDIGAGTTDFGLFLVRYSHGSGASRVDSIEHGYDVISKAGNFIDRILIEHVLAQADFDKTNPKYQNQVNVLQLNVREYKETLFSDGSVSISLVTHNVVTIELDSFMALKPMQEFAEEFEKKLIGVLEQVDETHLMGAPRGHLALKITGGGANLPFAKSLYERNSVTAGTTRLLLKKVRHFPEWLSETAPDLEDDFPQLAVAIGGARFTNLSYEGEVVRATGVGGPIQLEGYYTRGN